MKQKTAGKNLNLSSGYHRLAKAASAAEMIHYYSYLFVADPA